MSHSKPIRYQIKIESTAFGAAEAGEIGRVIEPLLDTDNALLVLDLSAVERIDWHGLQAIAAAAGRVRPKGDVVVCGASHEVAGMIHLVRIDQKLRLFPNLEAACQALD